ncbi:MAG: T9SS type A sorting domain-containing protein [Prolixibacteraceae bacterium]|nr:T9SS type A sorting domain-containing protein [Prolixibacteraceae bacterium]MBT6766055.1 T9SS type A sorting domain-containing protein [Prolixibacteraceae bacterium]MBT6998458.1 T9SS type A sorting domain-containing protein [Prolixibacteraceae bacterium]MBT7394385.1 T9SS type A sorting domain-containing protein [Prolixibacteraceae bacterium]
MKKTLLQITVSICVILLFTSLDIKKEKIKHDNFKNSVHIYDDHFKMVERIKNYRINKGVKFTRLKSVAEEDSIPAFKTEFEYPDGQWIAEEYEWDTLSGVWNKSSKYIIYYENEPWVSDSTLFFEVDTLTWDWKFSGKFISSYNAQGQETEFIGYSFNDTTQLWNKQMRTTYLYDINGNLDTEMYYFWFPIDTGWAVTSKNLHTYNGNLQQMTEIFTWSDFFEKWDPVFKTEYLYDVMERMEERTDFMWDFVDNQYNRYSKSKFVYIGDTNNIDTLFNSFFGLNSPVWEIISIDIYNYNQNNNFLNSIDYYTPLLEEKSGKMEEITYKKTEVDVWTYSEEEITEIIENRSPATMVYPNPAKNQVTITIPNPEKCRLNIFDAHGKMVLSKQITQTNTLINTSEFEDGIYLFHINNNGKILINKIIKQ